LVLVELDGESASAAVLSIFVVGEEDAGAACFLWALFSFSLKLSDVVNFVEFQGGELDLGSLVLDLFWCGVDLLLPFSATAQNWSDDLDGSFSLDSEVLENTEKLKINKKQKITNETQRINVVFNKMYFTFYIRYYFENSNKFSVASVSSIIAPLAINRPCSATMVWS
jgi:hypothetical protein